ncbi:antitoxin Xre/MbcA/ParS toxin-binding domain-containing protein [Kaarinaea lacus]
MNTVNDDRDAQLAHSIMVLLDSWGVSSKDKIKILDFPVSPRLRSMRQYYQGKALPDDPQVMVRVEHIIGIADALRTSYPLNEKMPAYWLNQNNKRFGNRTPLTCMLEDGLDGIVAVRVHVDCAYDWEISDKIL